MSGKKALIVIDMQNDYLWEKRKAMFCYDTKSLVDAVNEAVAEYSSKGWDIIYIEQVFPDLITNKWIIGFSIKNTEGAELYNGLNVISEHIFEKNLPDSFTSKAFREFVRNKGYNEVALCGLDECGCVGATAKGAVKAGISVSLIEDATGRRFSKEKVDKMRRKLNKLGVNYI